MDSDACGIHRLMSDRMLLYYCFFYDKPVKREGALHVFKSQAIINVSFTIGF